MQLLMQVVTLTYLNLTRNADSIFVYYTLIFLRFLVFVLVYIQVLEYCIGLPYGLIYYQPT